MKHLCLPLLIITLLYTGPVAAKKKAKGDNSPEGPKTELSDSTFGGLQLRGIGPAIASGRISDLAIDPNNPKRYFVATASGGLWLTTNAGTTWEPVFDGESSFSIGAVTLDPNDPLVVWVGTGENNSQRSVGYGDGVYKSTDGGRHWKRVGLEHSEHIAKIVVDPNDSKTVYVAAQGPLWSAGGDRGLYKTTDGGETWTAVLEISEHTGVSDMVMDPRDSQTLYAAAYQRRRRVWTLINGGPESALYKSTDGGETWDQLNNGLPSDEIGRIGLAISPVNPDVLYAIVEAAGDGSGFYRSRDRGGNWEKRSDYVSLSPQYYQEIFADPVDVNRVYSMDVWMMVTEDGGANFQQVGENYKHVDNHALWIDPKDTEHLLAGCDGGVYETYDRGATWDFKTNLPITQFYKVAVDNAEPFYNVYGGTQDNFSLGGPSRTINQNGITNREWIVTLGGDGFQTRVDPENPDIVYSQAQYGVLVRFDKQSGEQLDIQPQPAPGDDPLRWNWDSPLIISPHHPHRLYFAAQRLFRSNDRGNSWTPVSGDLTRGTDRNELEVMGKVWSVDSVAKNRSTSPFGNVVSISESPRVEDLLYAGTDDGVVQVLEPGAEEWRKIESFPGVPELSYVDHLEASQHDDDTVYAAFNNHKSGDFKPYVFESRDRGRTWRSITANLPEQGSVYTLAEDHQDQNLLFAGTEFGLFFTLDRGESWIQLQGGMPTIAVRDLTIQKRENDLVAATFGRGFFILDDYTPLRHLGTNFPMVEAQLFPVKKTPVYMEAYPLGLRGKGHQGDSFYNAPNPPFGATFTYYLEEGLSTRAERRKNAEKEAGEKGEKVSYPSWDALRAEDREETPEILLTIEDASGIVVRRLSGPTSGGFHRVAWNFRFPHNLPVSLEPVDLSNPFSDPPRGPSAMPGQYRVRLEKLVDGEVTALTEPQSFEIYPLGLASIPAENLQALQAFQKKTASLQRAVFGASEAAAEAGHRIDLLQRAIRETPDASPELHKRALTLEGRLLDLLIELEGDISVARRSEPTPPSIHSRVDQVVTGHWVTTAAPTKTHRENYRIAAEAFGGLLDQLRQLIETDLVNLERDLEAAGAPWTPGRVPTWKAE